MTEVAIPEPLGRDAIIELLVAGACIQRDRHGAAIISVHGRCREDWEELRREGWLNMTIAGTYVLSDRGREAIERGL